MLTKTLEEIKNAEGVVIHVLEHQRDDEFHEVIKRLSEELRTSTDERACHMRQRKECTALLEAVNSGAVQPVYKIHQYVANKAVETWTTQKVQVLNALIYYSGLRLRVLGT
jgi:hypothetical protein